MSSLSKMILLGLGTALLAYSYYQIMDDDDEDIKWANINPNKIVTHITSMEQLHFFLVENPKALVCFYAPWCAYCKSFMPGFCSVATTLRREGAETCFAAINCTTHPMARAQYNIRGYPTINFFKNGNLVGEFAQYRTERNLYLFGKYPPKNTQDLIDRFTTNPNREL